MKQIDVAARSSGLARSTQYPLSGDNRLFRNAATRLTHYDSPSPSPPCKILLAALLGIAFYLTAAPTNANVLISDSQSPANPVQLGSTIEYTFTLTPDQRINTEVVVIIAGDGLDVVSSSGAALCSEVAASSGWRCTYGDKILTSNVEIQSPYLGREVVTPRPTIAILATKLADEIGRQDVTATIQGKLLDCESIDGCIFDGIIGRTTVIVESDKEPPTANAGVDQRLVDKDKDGNETVSLDGSRSSDSDGSIVSYQWLDESGAEIATGVSTAVPLEVGVHAITLRVTDNAGLTDEVTIRIEVVETGQILQVVSGPEAGDPGTSIGPFTVRLTDDDGRPLQDFDVNWSVVPAEAGSVTESTTPTDTNGEASNTLDIATSGTLKLRVLADGADPVEFTVNGLAITPDLDDNQVVVAVALDSACPALADLQGQALSPEEQDLLSTCESLSEADAEARAAALDQLAPEQVAAQGTAAIEAATTQVTNIDARLNALRGGAIGVSVGGLSLNVKGYSLPSVLWDPSARNVAEGGAASDDQGPPSKLGIFINGAITLGERDTTERETGFDFDTKGITAGADYRLTDQLIVGGALGYATTDSEFDASSGTLDVEALNLSVYGTYYQSSRAYIDGIVSFGSYDYETSRRLSTTTEQSGEGDTTGTEFTFSLGAGYDFNRKSFTFGPYGRLNYAQVDIDGYAEQASDPGAAGSGSVLELGDQQIDSLSTVVGGLATYAISTSKGVFIPQARFEWEHEFSDDSRLITARFIHDPTATEFALITEEPDRDYFNLGVGMSAIFAGGKAAFLHYETQLGKADISQYSLKGGFRLEF